LGESLKLIFSLDPDIFPWVGRVGKNKNIEIELLKLMGSGYFLPGQEKST